MKRIVSLLLVAALMLTLAACGGSQTPSATNDGSGETQAATPAPAEPENLTETQKIIQEAQGMTLEELAKKAIEESNGKMFYGVGNSSRGKSALPLFIEYLQSIDSSYTLEFEWQQPKNNKIFDQLTADSLKDTGTFAMTLIQDGNQIESKMVQTGILDTFIPKDWAEANGTTAEEYTGYLPLQTLNKIFMYNNTGSKTYDNCWDFVAEGEHGELHRSVYQPAGQNQSVAAPAEYGVSGGGHLRGLHFLRRHLCVSHYPDQSCLETVPQFHFHLPLHHAPVDPGGGVAEPVQLQRRHRHLQRSSGCHPGHPMPLWWCKGLFPCLVVLGLHYAPFAYILIGGIFRNMDANLEEAATILDTPKCNTIVNKLTGASLDKGIGG